MNFKLPIFNLSSETINKISIIIVIALFVLGYFLYENSFKSSMKKIDLSDDYKKYLSSNFFRPVSSFSDNKTCFKTSDTCNEELGDGGIDSGLLCVNDSLALCPDIVNIQQKCTSQDGVLLPAVSSEDACDNICPGDDQIIGGSLSPENINKYKNCRIVASKAVSMSPSDTFKNAVGGLGAFSCCLYQTPAK